MTLRDCSAQGHIWREGIAHDADWNEQGEYIGSAPLYQRRRGTALDVLDVFCQYCTGAAQLRRDAGFSGVRAPGQPVSVAIPPQFQTVLDRALATTTGPVPKSP